MLTFSEGYPPGGSHTSTWYLVGDFDGRRFRPTQAKRLMDDGPDFYASQSWSNVPSESKPSRWQLPATRSRSIVIAWMNNWNYAQTVPTRPWRGHMTVPRELALQKLSTGDYRLLQWPVAELESLRQTAQVVRRRNVPLSGEAYRPGITGAELDIEAAIEVGEASEVGLRLRVGSGRQIRLFWSKTQEALLLDRRSAGSDNLHLQPNRPFKAAMPADNGLISLRVLLDRSSIEVFARNGRVAISSLVFPSDNQKGLELYAIGAGARIRDLTVYPMKSIW